MKFLRVFTIDLRQVFSWRLAAAILFTFIIYSFAGFGFVNDECIDVWYILEMAVWGSTAFFTIYVIPAFSFAPSLAMEWQSGASRLWIIRTGSDRYTISKILGCAVSGFLTHFVATVLLMVVLSAKLPLYIKSSTTELYEITLMQNGHPLTGMILFIADRSLKAVIAAEIGMVASVFFIHPYVAIAAPLGIILTMSRLIYKYNLPFVLDIAWWNSLPVNSAGEAILYKLFLTLLYTVFFSWLAVIGMRRRIAHV